MFSSRNVDNWLRGVKNFKLTSFPVYNLSPRTLPSCLRPCVILSITKVSFISEENNMIHFDVPLETETWGLLNT